MDSDAPKEPFALLHFNGKRKYAQGDDKMNQVVERLGVAPLTISSNVPMIGASSLALEASIFGLAERYGRGKTSHTMQVWWARRPHSAMRAVTFASLVQQDQDSEETLRQLLSASSYSDPAFAAAKKNITASEQPPLVLDIFGGGGTIPFEAAALGAESHSCDYNPLSVFIQNTNLVLSQKAFSKQGKRDTIDIIRLYGERILNNVKSRSDDIFPLRASGDKERTFCYFWTYTTECDSCGTRYPLQKRPWLSKKTCRAKYMKPNVSKQDVKWSIEEHGQPSEINWKGRSGSVNCPKCNTVKRNIKIDESRDELCAVGILKASRGKRFEVVSQEKAYPEARIAELHSLLEAKLGRLPKTDVPRWSGIINPSLYGVAQHTDVLNPRQRTVLMLLIDELQMAAEEVESVYSKEAADFMAGALSSLIDQVVDWNCRLSMWIPQNEQVGRAFCGPGVAMLWDYAETDQLLDGPANLNDKLTRILRAVEEIPEFDVPPVVVHSTAQKLPFEARKFDAIVTDPPYYDNMFYNTLADFFYVWKRFALGVRFPELFELEKSGEDDELVASTKRRGTAGQAHDWYCKELTKALDEARRVLKDDGVISFVYGHSSISGWSAVAEAFKNAKLSIVNVQPLSIERRARPRAMTSEAVNTCIVLVAQKKDECAHPIVEELDIGAPLQSLGWTSEDAGMATFAHEVGRLINAGGDWCQSKMKEYLIAVAANIGAKYPGFHIKDRKPI